MLRTEMWGRGIAVQGGDIGDAWAGDPCTECGGASVIETGTAADLVGKPGRGGGIEVDLDGHRDGEWSWRGMFKFSVADSHTGS